MGSYCYCLIIQPGADEQRKHLSPGRYQVGASSGSDIQIDHDTVSREHLLIEVPENGGVVLKDCDSTNGTRVNGERIQSIAIDQGAELSIGSVPARLLPLTDQQSSIAVRGRDSDVDGKAVSTETDITATAAGQTARAAVSAVATALGVGRPPQEVVADVIAEWCELLPVDGMCVLNGDNATVAMAGQQSEKETQRFSHGEFELVIHGGVGRVPRGLRGPAQLLLMMLAQSTSQPSQPGQPGRLPDYPGVKTLNATLKKTLGECGRVARGQIPVLILGESGSGKELLARWIHECSLRSGQAFRAVNCAAVPENLLEAELFGVAKGAATGVEARTGVIAQASGGTLFLDEIGDMTAEVQVRLLRAIEEGLIWPVGAQKPTEVDVRIVAATHHDLHQRVADGGFRLDLMHRLTGYEAQLPPLRERPEDIPGLVTYFLNEALAESTKSSPGVTTAALSCLLAWHWPGNVRELRNEIQRAVLLLDDGEPLEETRLSPRLQGQKVDHSLLALDNVVREAERRAFSAALSCADGKPNEAMALLGLSRSSYYRKLKDLGLDSPDDTSETGA